MGFLGGGNINHSLQLERTVETFVNRFNTDCCSLTRKDVTTTLVTTSGAVSFCTSSARGPATLGGDRAPTTARLKFCREEPGENRRPEDIAAQPRTKGKCRTTAVF
ncbi:unnamed protein product [Amoebophrya sp. A120]|nr:unnamed protein product [Amoebophrya sp. A120]|eukprot:GSA120T00022840001.1